MSSILDIKKKKEEKRKNMEYKRIFLVVMDSVGMGRAKDAANYEDEGANTLGHILEQTKIELPNLKQLGLYNLLYDQDEPCNGCYTNMEEVSNGKDTLTGHSEMMGIITKVPFKTFTETGFPKELIKELEEKTGRKVIGNKNASGTEIIEELGKEHMETGAMIVYTSADSVLQIAAHEDIIPLKELYHICEIAREITKKPEYKVGRIIARPFIGTPGNFTRTSNRHDYALDPSGITDLDELKRIGLDVIAIGKISDIFNHRGITKSIKTQDNLDGIHKIIDTIHTSFHGLCFANLNDFDSKYGHRRNVEGYANALKELDNHIPEILQQLKEDDLFILTADHGNDPTWKGTDHTRENVPLLIYSKHLSNPGRIPTRKTFADLGETIVDNFQGVKKEVGTSFLNEITTTN